MAPPNRPFVRPGLVPAVLPSGARYAKMHSAHRYAVYYAPPEASPLARFSAAWLGWDPVAGCPVGHPNAPPLTADDVAQVTKTPRRYGFHGTLKAPFRLADGCGYDDLVASVSGIAAALAPFTLPGLRLSRLGRFIALTPAGDAGGLERLAERVTIDLDTLRAPLDAAELAKRRKSGLTPRQEGYLQRWGYPYVLDEFRFHLTLTGALAPAEGERAMAALRPLVALHEAEPFVVAEVCLFADPGGGANFRLIERLPLTG